MLEILSWISISLISFILCTLWALWILYVAMMNVKGALIKDHLPWQAKILVYPTTLVFNVVEFIANVFACTMLFFDWPKELTVSDRLRRYSADPKKYGWRLWVVNFFKPMLDPFDPTGPHI